jgi:hypothetical protein
MAGVKGRSGRKTRGLEISIGVFTSKRLQELDRDMSNPLVPEEFKRQVRLVVVTKLVPTKQEQAITLIPGKDQSILDRYSNTIEDNRLGMITGNTAQATDNDATGVLV